MASAYDAHPIERDRGRGPAAGAGAAAAAVITAEGPLGSAQERPEVVPGVVLEHAGQVRHDAAVGQHGLDADHLRPGHAVGDDVDAAGVGRDGAADGRRVTGGEVDAVGPAGGRACRRTSPSVAPAPTVTCPERWSTASSGSSRRVDSTDRQPDPSPAPAPIRPPVRCCPPGARRHPRRRARAHHGSDLRRSSLGARPPRQGRRSVATSPTTYCSMRAGLGDHLSRTHRLDQPAYECARVDRRCRSRGYPC